MNAAEMAAAEKAIAQLRLPCEWCGPALSSDPHGDRIDLRA